MMATCMCNMVGSGRELPEIGSWWTRGNDSRYRASACGKVGSVGTSAGDNP